MYSTCMWSCASQSLFGHSQKPLSEALLWEAFFVDCLGRCHLVGVESPHSSEMQNAGAQPRRPADWRQERVPADLAFSLGQELGTLVVIILLVRVWPSLRTAYVNKIGSGEQG